ncbi:uncharacterized protein TNCV_2540261 [Trichonephila clavipes]|nr:uncharacterized protein TNCV_2540261 [Trichonephila clavipes]
MCTSTLLTLIKVDCKGGLSYRSIAARVGRDPMTVSRIWIQWVQDGNTEHRAGSQWHPITSSREDRHVNYMALTDSAAASRALSQDWGCLPDNKCLYTQFDDVCNSIISQLGDHGCGYPWHCITDRSVFNGVIKDEPGRTNGETSFSQMNPGCV